MRAETMNGKGPLFWIYSGALMTAAWITSCRFARTIQSKHLSQTCFHCCRFFCLDLVQPPRSVCLYNYIYTYSIHMYSSDSSLPILITTVLNLPSDCGHVPFVLSAVRCTQVTCIGSSCSSIRLHCATPLAGRWPAALLWLFLDLMLLPWWQKFQELKHYDGLMMIIDDDYQLLLILYNIIIYYYYYVYYYYYYYY